METVNLGAAVVALALTIVIPVLFILYVFRFRRLQFFLPDILVGIIVAYFAQTLLFAFTLNVAMAFLPGVMATRAGQQVVYVVLATLDFMLGYYLVFYIGYHRQFSEGQVSRVAIGGVVVKAMADTISAALSNLTVAQRMADGTLADYLASVVNASSGINVDALVQAYQSYGVPQFMMPAILTMLSVQTVYLFLILMGEHRSVLAQVGLVAAFSFFYYFNLAYPVPTVVVIGAMGLLIVELYIIYVLMRAQVARVNSERAAAAKGSPEA